MAKELNVPLSGMTSAHPMNIKENQYPFMLNGNIQTDVSGPITLTNEHSNILCNQLPEDYKVIGTLYVPEDNITYVFLVDPINNKSQIGYISEYIYNPGNDLPQEDPCDNCGTINIEETPLEQTEQEPTCAYTCVVAGDCLNFNINFPIRKAVFKKDNCGDSIYFTDFFNPVRALKLTPEHLLDDSQRTIIGYTGDCVDEQGGFVLCDDDNTINSDCQCVDPSGTVIYDCTCCQPIYQDRCTDTDVNCTKLRLFPEAEHICIEPLAVFPGGTLLAGTYQLAAAYADQNGERATRTFTVSNPVSVFDPNQTVTDQTNYPTGLAIKFLIKDLQSAVYSYIDVFVIATINGVASVKRFPTIDISSLIEGTLEYTVSDFEKGEDATIDDVMQVFPVYEKAQEITSAGNTILLGNLTGPRDLNLQRAVIGLSPSIRWMSSEANEWFYNDGANCANYRTYLRDELYGLGLVFERNNTLDTCAYPLIGRAVNTAFTAVQPAIDDTCTATWVSDIPGFSIDPDAVGKALFSFVGTWIPTKNYKTRDLLANDTSYDIVIHEGVYYIAIADNINSEPPSSDWVVFDAEDSCNLCVNDLQDVFGSAGADVFQLPGCDPRTGGGDTNRLRWEVYNTACNAGEICSPIKQTTECVDVTEEVKCHSFRYTIPTASATFALGVTTLNLTVDPTTLGIYSGATVSGQGIADGTIIVGPITTGLTIDIDTPTTSSELDPVTLSFSIGCFDLDASGVCDASAICDPQDCYLDSDDKCIPCVDNYTHPLADVNHYATWNILTVYVAGQTISYDDINYVALIGSTGAQPDISPTEWQALGPNQSCPSWPPTTDDGCNPGFVRTRQDAIDYYNANGVYLLCIDATLAALSNLLAEPYVVKKSSEPVKILDASTKPWYVYDIVGGTTPPAAGSIQDLIIDTNDPTADFQNSTKGPTDPVCIESLFRVSPVGQPLPDYLFPGVNMPDQDPENYNPTNAIASFNPSPEGKCNDYGPTAPLMYMLGHDLDTPSSDPCDGCTDCDASGWTGDYWDIGAAASLVGEVNQSKYQSYWYSFTATALQPTIIIKSKIFYKFGEFTGAGHSPDTTTVGSKDIEEQGDFRIDVYEGSPLLATPTYSTGEDSVNPATYRYATGTPEQDWGVLIIGDVANSSGQATTAGQLPLTVGQTYYVHIYTLPQGTAKLDKSPIANPNKEANCIGYDADEGSCCPCYFANYAWMNLCMNSAVSDESKVISLPETWEVECEYELHYRQNQVVDHGCLIQTFEWGSFAFWQSQTKKYPPNPEVWGDLCGQPIRHFKFPDCLVSKLQDQDPLIPVDPVTGLPSADGPFNSERKAKIYPIGFRVNPEDVKAWLEWAVLEGLITEEEKLSITGYKLVRANRVGNKSIAAKGLLYDMWRYKEHDYVNNAYSNINTYYPSYPFNDFKDDQYLNKGGTAFKHPFSGNSNNRFSFVSPDTTFNTPTLGDELKMESVVFGDALGNFYQVKNHPKYTLLSQGGIALAAALAAIQLSGDLLIALGQLLGQFDVGFSNTIPVGSIVGFVGAFLDLAPKFFIYAREWRDIILNFGVPKNFTKYYAAVGNYHSSGELGEVQNAGNKRRLIKNSTYLLAGNLGTSDNGILSKINNYQREDSVYLFLDKLVNYVGTILKDSFLNDTSRFIMSDNTDNKSCSLIDRQSNVASYYAAIKYNVPDQYGSIHDIEWLYTGACIPLEWEEDQNDEACEPIFGGDTFISRMTQKGKIPFFLDNPVGANASVDFQYQHISNITDATYYFNSVGESTASSSSIQFVPVEHNFDCVPVDSKGNPKSPLYLDGTIYLFSYGIKSFICESDFNLNFRYATDTKGRDFYPHQSDIENWTQEYRIPIETPNAYLYNRTYSKQNKENFFCTQPAIYSNADCVTTYRNRVINSIPDQDSDFATDPWRIFLGNDYADFPLTNGQLVGIDGIERQKVMLRFNNTSLVFNAYYTMTTDAGVAQIGTSSMFAQKPLEYAKTDIGYGGTQHHAFTSTQFGHFWVDAQRSAVFMLPPGDSGLEEISQSYNTFFNNNLPFFILKDFPTYPVDNNYKDIGITLVWDNRFDRMILTKLDYELKSEWKTLAARSLDDVTPENPAIHFFEDVPFQGMGIFLVTTDGVVTEYTKLELTDTTYFCNKSWTMGYSPISKSWISFYSFVPNYYISHDNYFQSGINYPQSGDSSEIGVWNHLITNKSYQVFYGKLHPFTTDVVVKNQFVNKQLSSVEYQADFLRFQNDYDYFYNPGVTFNKAVIWSENRNTGNLELVPQVQNNMAQGLLYPSINANSTSVLVTNKENNWRINQFYDLVRNKQSNVPPMIYECHPYLKKVNPLAIDYNKPTFQRSRLTSDYFTFRLINDTYSNYKIINKWFLNNSIKSDS